MMFYWISQIQKGKKWYVTKASRQLTALSIIFTCWTRTLDLIVIYLKKNGLTAHNYQRIDGDCTTSKREKILDKFSKDSENRILIMTTGTGAVGYVDHLGQTIVF